MGNCNDKSKSVIVPIPYNGPLQTRSKPKTIDIADDRSTCDDSFDISTPPNRHYLSCNFKPNDTILFYHPELLCWIQSIVLKADSKNAVIYPIMGFEKILRSQYSHSLSKKYIPNEPIMTINKKMFCISRIKAILPNKYCYDCDKSLDIHYDKIPRMSKYDTWIGYAKHQMTSHDFLVRTYKSFGLKFSVGEWVDLQVGNFGITGWTSGIVYEVDEMCYSVAVETPEKGIIGICILTGNHGQTIHHYKSNSYDGTNPRPHQMVIYQDKLHHIVNVCPTNSFSYSIGLYKNEDKLVDSSEIYEISLENVVNFLKSDRPTLMFYYDN